MTAASIKRQVSAFIPSDMLDSLHDILIISSGFEKAPLTNKYEVLRGRLNGKLIIAYSSGKVVYEESEEARSRIERLLYERYKDEGIVVGSDEAGKGEAIGPLVIAAVALDPKQAAYLQSLGVADSKVVPEDRMDELAKAIKHKSISHEVLIIDPPTFNEMFQGVKDVNRNLNDILAWGHSRVLQSVVSKISDKPVRIVVDEFDTSKRRVKIRMIEGLLEGRRVYAMPRAEVVPAVAAASILAKNGCLEWIHRNLSESQLEQIRRGKYAIARSQEEFQRVIKVSYVKKLMASSKGHSEANAKN